MRRLALLAALCVALPAGAGIRPRYGGEVAVELPRRAIQLDPARAATAADLYVASLLHQPPLARGADGALAPVLLAAPPRSEDGGATFRLELRPGLRFHDGREIRAPDLAATLLRLRAGRWAALLLPVREVVVRSEREVEVRLAFPYPRWPEALAEAAAGVVPDGFAGTIPPGAGPFLFAAAGDGSMRLEAFAGHAEGRPFLDAVELRPGDGSPRTAEASRIATYLLVAPHLAPGTSGSVAGAIDREDLVRRFAAGAAAPLATLLPHHPRRPAAAESGTSEAPLVLLYDAGQRAHQRVAERIQLRLHDRGITVRLEAAEEDELLRRTRAGRYDLALVQLPLPREAGLAAAALLHASGRVDEALRLLARVGAARDPDAALDRALGEIRGILPIYRSTEAVGPAREGRLCRGDDLARAWLRPEAAP